MSNPKKSAPAQAEDPKRAALLEAAFGVFARFGYRKTSMDEVARAAQHSRQGLYLHFANKEELFRAGVQHTIATTTEDALRALQTPGRPLSERLVAAFDQWVGRYVGRFTSDAADLIDAVEGLLPDTIKAHQDKLLDAVAAALREDGLAALYKPAGITARQLAENLQMTAKGLKMTSESREEFLHGITLAVRILCAPALGNR